jgi:glucose dehydrogenase
VRFVVAAIILLTLLAASPAAYAKAVRPSGPVDAVHRTSYGQDPDWTSYGHDAQLTNHVFSQSLAPRTASRLALQWRTKLDSAVTASPLAARIDVGGIMRTLVFVATWAGSVSALDAQTGGIVWTRTFGSVDTGVCGEYGIASTPAIDLTRGRLYAIGADGLLRGLDLATGDDAPGFPIRLIDRTSTEYVWGGLRIVQDRLYVPVGS